jgi:hypothetical protein
VKFEGGNWDGPKVIGFKDNPNGCGWRLRLVRADGEIVTDSWYSINISVYNSSQSWVAGLAVYHWSWVYEDSEDGLYVNGGDVDPEGSPWTIEKLYNAATKEWMFETPSASKDPNGYYLSVSCKKDYASVTERAITTFNNGCYNYDLRWSQPALQEGKHNYLIHYWDSVVTSTGVPAEYTLIPNYGTMTFSERQTALLALEGARAIVGSNNETHYFQTGASLTRTVMVKSSISFTVEYGYTGTNGSSQYIVALGFALGQGLQGENCDEPYDLAVAGDNLTTIVWPTGSVSFEVDETPGAADTTTEECGATFTPTDIEAAVPEKVPLSSITRTVTMSMQPTNMSVNFVCWGPICGNVPYTVNGSFSHFESHNKEFASWLAMQRAQRQQFKNFNAIFSTSSTVNVIEES